jgi:hypothetical protein
MRIANNPSVTRQSTSDELYTHRVKTISAASISSLAKLITEIRQEKNCSNELAECMSIRDYFMSTAAQYTSRHAINTL